MRDFDYSTLTYDKRVEIHNALAETTAKHIIGNSELFSPMLYDPARNPSQMLETVHLPPAPSTFAEIRGLAGVANEPMAHATAEALSKQPAYISAVRYLLDVRRENVNFVTAPHENIGDVAFVQEGWVEAGYNEEEDWQGRNGIGISRGVTTIEAFGMAASEVVQKMGHVFMSFPRTSTIEALDLDPLLIETNNRTWRSEVRHWLSIDPVHKLRRTEGKSLHLAWEGKTTKINYGDDHTPERLQLGKVSNGTIEMIKHGAVQPIVILEKPEPTVVIGELTEVKNRDDVLRVQKWQADKIAGIFGISRDRVTIEGMR